MEQYSRQIKEADTHLVQFNWQASLSRVAGMQFDQVLVLAKARQEANYWANRGRVSAKINFAQWTKEALMGGARAAHRFTTKEQRVGALPDKI